MVADAVLPSAWKHTSIEMMSPNHTTKAVVIEQLNKARYERDRGSTPATGGDQTVESYLRAWLDQKQGAIETTTWQRYRACFEHVIRAYGNLKLTKLSRHALATLYANLQQTSATGAKRLKSSSVRRLHTVLHAALNDALYLGLIAENPAAHVKAPKNDKFQATTLTISQVHRLLAAAQGDRLEALWILAVTTGARLGELLALSWNNVEFGAPGETCSLSILASLRPTYLPVRDVEDSLHRGHLRWEIGKTKTERSRRRIVLPEIAVEALQAHKARQDQERERAGELWQEHNLIFCTEIGAISIRPG